MSGRGHEERKVLSMEAKIMTVNVTTESSDTGFKGIVRLDMKIQSSFTSPSCHFKSVSQLTKIYSKEESTSQL